MRYNVKWVRFYTLGFGGVVVGVSGREGRQGKVYIRVIISQQVYYFWILYGVQWRVISR